MTNTGYNANLPASDEAEQDTTAAQSPRGDGGLNAYGTAPKPEERSDDHPPAHSFHSNALMSDDAEASPQLSPTQPMSEDSLEWTLAQAGDDSQPDEDQQPSDSSQTERVRCICGQTEDDGTAMLSCDSCNVWQHIRCVGTTEYEAESISYRCDLCDPQGFQERSDLREAISRSLNPDGQGTADEAQLSDDEEIKFSDVQHQSLQDSAEDHEDRSPDADDLPTLRALRRSRQVLADSDEDETEVVPSSGRERAHAQRAAKRAKLLISDSVSDEDDDDTELGRSLLSPLRPIDIEISPSMKHLQRFNKAIKDNADGLKLLKLVQPTKIAGRVSAMDSFLASTVVDGRRHKVVKCWATKSRLWRFWLQDESQPQAAHVEFSGPLITKDLCPKEADALSIGHMVCKLLDRLPLPPTAVSCKAGAVASMPGVLASMAVVSHLFPGQDWSSLAGSVSSFRGVACETAKDRVSCRVFTIVDGKADDITLHFDVKRLDLSVPVPAVGTLAQLFPALPDDKELKKKVGDKLFAEYKHGLQALRYVQFKMYGLVGTRQDMFRHKDTFLEGFQKTEFKDRQVRLL